MNTQLFVLSAAARVLTTESHRMAPRETGGILIGYWTRSYRVVITHATGPGPQARHGYSSFMPDHAYCQRVLDEVFDETQGELTYLGDWHSHPWGLVRPSPRDAATMLEIARDRGYCCPRPLLALCRPHFQWKALRVCSACAFWLFDPQRQKTNSIRPTVIEEIRDYHVPEINHPK